MAGTDFKTDGGAVLGDPSGYDPGFIAILDQVDLGGTGEIDGWIQAADEKASPSSDTDGLVNDNKVSGDFKLNFKGNLNSPFPGDVRIMSWREVIGST